MKCCIKQNLLVLLFFLTIPFLFSQNNVAEKPYGENLVIKIALIGPGDELYFWWGHIALVIEDKYAGTERFYDYGIFSFESENFFTNFAMGRLIYSCGVSLPELNYSIYKRTNRDIILYTLDLMPEKREAVQQFAETNVLPENRYYFYHHFNDNCSTRIRDIIDFALDGQFKDRFANTKGRFTFRQHIRRNMWFSPIVDWYLNFLMGKNIDKPITVWEEMFLPAEVALRIEDLRYIDPNGDERILVTKKEILNESVNRHIVLDSPQRLWPKTLIVGLIISGILIFFLIFNKKILYTINIVLAILFGFSGLLLFFMTFFTNHDYTYNNINVLFVNPLILIAIPFGVIAIKNKTPKTKRLFAQHLVHIVWTYVVLGCIISIIIKVFPSFYQENQAVEALMLPFSLSLSFIPLWVLKVKGKKRRF